MRTDNIYASILQQKNTLEHEEEENEESFSWRRRNKTQLAAIERLTRCYKKRRFKLALAEQSIKKAPISFQFWYPVKRNP